MTNLPNTGSGSEAEPEKLPTGERFELYVDEDGDYVLKMKDRPSHHISVHGEHANEAVAKMVDTIHELDAMNSEAIAKKMDIPIAAPATGGEKAAPGDGLSDGMFRVSPDARLRQSVRSRG